ncbi:MAG: hypothetical protein KME43_16735 [Myxacorys chilensis ATA2-1-KO14]|jgi:hypothetical protein|nr:hypothetical protein [Myxacorys chilensis ATA2-1-KO14]
MQTRQLSDAAILEAIAAEWGTDLEQFSYAQKAEALVVLGHLVHNGDLADVQSNLLPRKFLMVVNQISIRGVLGLITKITAGLHSVHT